MTTTQSELREALNSIKSESGKGSKARRQKVFTNVYTENVGHIVTGERYDDAGVGPAKAENAVENVYPDLDYHSYDTVSDALITVGDGDNNSLEELVADLDSVARRSGNAQQEYLEYCLEKHAEPSLVTLAILDDESLNLGTSQMREAFFDGTRNERKHREAFVETTNEFIRLAQEDALPTRPIIGEPFDPMLAVPESRGQPQNPVAQRKLDGYRILIHIKQEEIGPKAYAFTRAKNDETQSLPELNEIDWPEQGEYILDGEVLAETGSYSDTSSRVGRDAENVEREVEMNFHIFDIIVKDGVDISNKPFGIRHMAVNSFVDSVDDSRLQSVPLNEDIERAKDEAVANEEEGIIVKDKKAPYEFGKRSTYWQKRKFDNETCDVVIAGFEEGTGEASGTLGAVALETADGFYVGNSGSGFSDAQRDEIWENQDEWMGRTIEVEARGIGSQGKLRMPIFKHDRSDDGEADTWERVQEIMKDV